jgi:hypothetical protein
MGTDTLKYVDGFMAIGRRTRYDEYPIVFTDKYNETTTSLVMYTYVD